MKHNNGFDDIVSTTTVVLPSIENTITKRKQEIDDRLKEIQAVADKAATDKDLAMVNDIHGRLFGKKGRHTFSEKIKYAIWLFGIALGVAIGWVLALLVNNQIDDVKAFDGLGFPIWLLIVLIFGGLGWFAAHWFTDKKYEQS